MKKALILGGTGAMGRYLVDIMSEWDNWIVYVTSRNRHNDIKNVKYLCGNAKNIEFLDSLLNESYDVIIDFMNWGYQEFIDNYNQLLNSAVHYVFLSSSRVYANSESPITENSSRLLETTDDAEFLLTQRYALRKARQEDMLISSQKQNFTIIRPYISYSPDRLQLGVYEKDDWLGYVFNGNDIVIRKEILDSKTSMTWSYDVSYAISKIINNPQAYGQAIQIASDQSMKWKDILKIYIDAIYSKTELRPEIYVYEDIQEIDDVFEGGYQTKYDRMWDRSFDSSKVERIIGEKINYEPIETGVKKCVEKFLENPCFGQCNTSLYELFDDAIKSNRAYKISM